MTDKQADNSKIQVAVRVRPLVEHELNSGEGCSKFMVDGNKIM